MTNTPINQPVVDFIPKLQERNFCILSLEHVNVNSSKIFLGQNWKAFSVLYPGYVRQTVILKTQRSRNALTMSWSDQQIISHFQHKASSSFSVQHPKSHGICTLSFDVVSFSSNEICLVTRCAKKNGGGGEESQGHQNYIRDLSFK